MQLNIIGNGFDLYHGLPSRYTDFANWLINNDKSLFKDIGKYFNANTYVMEYYGYENEVVRYLVDDKFWSKFEEELGNLNIMAFEETLLDDLGLENDDPVSLIDDVYADKIAINLKKQFAEWVKTFDIKKNYALINKLIGYHKANLSKGDGYINFNYTHSLQNIYNIPLKNIYYIHGQSDLCSNLVVGHGNSREIKEIEYDIRELEKNYSYCQADRNRIDEKKCELSFLKTLEKNISYTLSGLISYINKLESQIDQIYTYGFSFGDVDMPYIKFLAEKYPNAKWHISYYTEDVEYKRTIKAKLNNYVKSSIYFFKFNNSNSNYIRETLINNNI